jgi:hypothetical protein
MKPWLAGHMKPQPSEALVDSPGLRVSGPEAMISRAEDPISRLSRAGKTLMPSNLGIRQTHLGVLILCVDDKLISVGWVMRLLIFSVPE